MLARGVERKGSVVSDPSPLINVWLQVRYSASLRFSLLLKQFNIYCTLATYQELRHVPGAYTTWLLKQCVPERREHPIGTSKARWYREAASDISESPSEEVTLLNIFKLFRFHQGEFSVQCQCAFKIFSSGIFSCTSQSWIPLIFRLYWCYLLPRQTT